MRRIAPFLFPILLFVLFGAGPSALLADTISTTTTFTLTPGTATTDQQIVLTATVKPAGVPGMVEFNYSLAGQPFQAVFGQIGSDGIAVAVTGGTYIAPGTYSVQALYPGRTGSYAPSSSAPATFTIVPSDGPAESSFAGQYAFLFQGFSTTANPYASAGAGSFTADGHGRITAGIMDVVTPSATYWQIPVTGTYSLANSGQGTLTLRSPTLPNQPMVLNTTTAQALATVQTAAATPYDGALFGSLRIAKQTTLSAVPIAQYAVQMSGLSGPTSGSDPAVLVAISGSLTLNGATLSPSAILQQTVGANSIETINYNTLSFNSEGAFDPTTGLFRVSLDLAGAFPCGEQSHPLLDAYAVDATHLFLVDLVTVDACGSYQALSGTAEQ